MSKWEKNLEFYDKLVAKNPKFDRKGKTMPYTSANTYMFSLLNKDAELGFRLPKKVGAEFIEKYNSKQFMSHGAKMKDFVFIPEELYHDTALLSEYLEISYLYVMSLKAKK